MDATTTGARVAPENHVRWTSRLAGISKAYRGITKWSLIALFFLLPLFALPITVDILEVNKQTLLVILTFIATLSWLGEQVSKREFTYKRGWMNVFPLLLIVSILISSITSLGNYVSWIGQAGQEYASMLTAGTFLLLFYLILNTASEIVMQRKLLIALILSTTIMAVQVLLHLLNVPVFSFLGGSSRIFNTVGTINSLAIFLTVVTVMVNGIWLVGKARLSMLNLSKAWRIVLNICTFILSAITLVILSALDFWVLWVLLVVGILSLFTFALMRANEFQETSKFIIPMALFVVALLLLFLKSPISFNIPAEISPSYSAGWNISKQTLQNESALFGSGPGTFMYNYAKYHSPELNSTSFWQVRFDRSNSHILTLLATLGILGTFLFLLFIFVIKIKALNRLIMEKNHAEWKMTFILFSAWIVVILSMFLYSSNMSLQFLFWSLSALIAGQVMKKTRTLNFNRSPRMGLTFSFLFVIVTVAIVTVMFVTGQRYAAEIAFAQAVETDQSENSDLNAVIQKLDKAATYNKWSDVYYRNLSQALLLRVREELTAGQVVPPEQAAAVQQLVASSINSAKQATDLAPNNVANWEIRGAIYREVSPIVGGANEFAIASYERAHELEPSSPVHLTNLGRAYMVFAENARMLLDSDNEEVAGKAETDMNENLKLAEDSLNKAIELKVDYAPAHYYLAVVLERQGRLADAISKMESVSKYNPLDVGVAFQLGILYIRQGKLDLAQAQLEKAIKLVPTYANARWFLAAIYEQKGDVDAAIAQVEAVKELNPDNPLVKAKLDRLYAGETTNIIPKPIESGEESATNTP